MEIRFITPDDADAYRDVLTRTSEEDRYCRFFHVVNHFDLSEIARFVEPRPDTFGLIAEDPASGALGVAHAFLISPGSAEIAIVVANDARLRGVGRALLGRLIAEARARGIERTTAFSLSANAAFASLARSVGMHTTGGPAEIITWTLDLTAAPVTGAAAAVEG